MAKEAEPHLSPSSELPDVPFPEDAMPARDWGRAVKYGRNLLAGTAAIASAASIGLGRASADPEAPAKPVPAAIEPAAANHQRSLETITSQAEQNPQEVIDKYNQKLTNLAQEITSSPSARVIRIDGRNTLDWGLPIGSKIYYLSMPSQQYPRRYNLMLVDVLKGLETPSNITVYYGTPGTSIYHSSPADPPNPLNLRLSNEYLAMGPGHAYKQYKYTTGGGMVVDGPIAKLNQGFLSIEHYHYTKSDAQDLVYAVSALEHQPFLGVPSPPFSEYVTYNRPYKKVESAKIIGLFDSFMKKANEFLAKTRK